LVTKRLKISFKLLD